MGITKKFTIPNMLTLFRLIVSPLFLPLLFVYLLPRDVFWINCSLAGLFVLFSLTDILDGYLARKYNQETSLGKILDPIADKFLTYSTLIALLAINRIYFYWVIILIGREFFVMGLRLVACEKGIKSSVSILGKLKTISLMSLLTLMIVNPDRLFGLAPQMWQNIEWGLLGFTIFLSLWSATLYYNACIAKLHAAYDEPEPPTYTPEYN